MSIDLSIEETITKALSSRILAPYPCYANRVDTARLLGISPQTLDRMFQMGTLDVRRHTTQFVPNGNIMYYIPQIIADLMPDRATVMILGKAS
jgi:hypothetical protein